MSEWTRLKKIKDKNNEVGIKKMQWIIFICKSELFPRLCTWTTHAIIENGLQCLLNSDLITDVNKDRKTHYKRLFMQLTQEFYNRSLLPPPLNLVYIVCNEVCSRVIRGGREKISSKILFGVYLPERVLEYIITVRAAAKGPYCFHPIFFLWAHNNSRTAARNLMKFCMNMSFDNRTKRREYQGYRSKVKVMRPNYRIFHHCEIAQKSLCTR